MSVALVDDHVIAPDGQMVMIDLADEALRDGLEKKLNPQKFARIHRGKIVNVSRIVAIHSLINGVYEMEIHNGVRLTTGRQFRNAVQNLIRK